MKAGSKAATKTKSSPRGASPGSASKIASRVKGAKRPAAEGVATIPARLPAGTTFILEGKAGKDGPQVLSRYLEFPDGTRLNLLAGAQRLPPAPRRVRRAGPAPAAVTPRTGNGKAGARHAGKRSAC